MTFAVVRPLAGCSVPRPEWRAWLNAMLERALADPEAACSAPECADAKRRLRAGSRNELVELALMHDADIAVLNSVHLACVGPTNILSFPAAPPEPGLGVLALGVEAWRREAVLYGQEPEAHARRLLAHGLAHLLGHDHGPAMDACCSLLLGE